MIDYLKGVKIVDLTTIVLGPMATQILADLGAEVIKVETVEGDLARASGTTGPDGMGSMFANNNRNKKSLSIDLKCPEGKQVLNSLIENADVFVHNMRPQAIDRLGFSPESVSELNPKVIYCSATGFGTDGVYAGTPAYDDIIQAACGLAGLPLEVNRSPEYAPSIIADKIAALHVVYALLAALLKKERTGRGSILEVPMFEALVAFTLNEHLDEATFNQDGHLGYGRLLNEHRRPFQTQNGWLAVMPYSKKQWTAVLSEIGRDDILSEPWFSSASERNRKSSLLYEALSCELKKKSTEQWIRELRKLDVPYSKVTSIQDLVSDQHLQDIDFFKPTDGLEGRVRSIPQPIVFSNEQAARDLPPPKLGAHSTEILGALGYSSEEVSDLIDRGIVVVRK